LFCFLFQITESPLLQRPKGSGELLPSLGVRRRRPSSVRRPSYVVNFFKNLLWKYWINGNQISLKSEDFCILAVILD
jgi:lipopolysaccharide assembly outer membrane protein LptD (OstA)